MAVRPFLSSGIQSVGMYFTGPGKKRAALPPLAKVTRASELVHVSLGRSFGHYRHRRPSRRSIQMVHPGRGRQSHQSSPVERKSHESSPVER